MSERHIQFRPDIDTMTPETVRQFAPNGVLRAGINMSNFLLVSERTPQGGPAGVSPSIAAAIAANLGVTIEYVPYPNPGALADAATRDEWDVALLGAEPQRAAVIAFTPAYAEIQATYLVPEASPFKTVADVDRKGVRIAVADRTAYGLWLDRNIQNAELSQIPGVDASLKLFQDERLDALAGLRPRLLSDAQKVEGMRVLPGRFMSVQQAIGVPRSKDGALPWLERFVAAARAQRYVAALIEKYGVQGLSVA